MTSDKRYFFLPPPDYPIETRKDLAKFFFGTHQTKYMKHMNYVLYGGSRASYYKKFDINKASGSSRVLHAVTGRLKELQRTALDKFQSIITYKPSSYSHGFTPKKSIITNAACHRRSKLIIKIDLQDFFPSIHFGRVQGMFMAAPFKFGKEAATTMAHLSCLDDESRSLPQGGVLSPYISNMLCRRMDKRLAKLARKNRCRFTRYADDMTFSTNDTSKLTIDEFMREIYEIIESERFVVNEKKTKILTRKDRQIVTGIVVNDGMNVNRKYIRNLRATIHNCEKPGGIKDQVVKVAGIKGAFSDDNKNTRVRIEKKGEQFFRLGKNGEKVKISDRDACEDFLSHLVGKLNFFRDVILYNIMVKNKKRKWVHYVEDNSNAKEGIDLDSFERLQTHAKLVTQLYQLVIKARKYEDIETALVNSGQKNPYLRTMKLISKKNKIIRKSLDDFRIKIKSKTGFPPIDNKRTREVLQSLRDSQNGLGALTHTDPDFTFKRGMNILFENYYHSKYYLPKRLRSEFDKYLKSFEPLGLKYGEVGTFDTLSNPEISTCTIELKNNTRFDDKGRSLKSLLEKCVKYAKKKSDSNKDVEVEIDVKGYGFYTHVPSIEFAMKNIIHSMLKNTKSSMVYIKTRLIVETAILELDVYDLKSQEWLFNCGNGKLHIAKSETEGLCDYWIDANNNDDVRKCFDMHTGRFIEEISMEKSGFAHRLRFYVETSEVNPENSIKSSRTLIAKTDDVADKQEYRVLFLDFRKDDFPKLKNNISKIFGDCITAVKSINEQEFNQGQFDVLFIHKNNKEFNEITSDWCSPGMVKIIFSGDGSFGLNKLEENKYEVSRQAMSMPKFEQSLQKIGLLK